MEKNEAYESLLERRSIRKYLGKPVDRSLLQRIVEAGLYAANGHNEQKPVIVAVTAPDVMDRLRRVNAEILGTQSDPFYGAPAALIVLVPADYANGRYDGALVMGNLMQAAYDLGLGSCWINRARETFARPEWQEFLRGIGLEGDYEGVGHCAVGYPAVPLPAARPRREGRVFWVE